MVKLTGGKVCIGDGTTVRGHWVLSCCSLHPSEHISGCVSFSSRFVQTCMMSSEQQIDAMAAKHVQEYFRHVIVTRLIANPPSRHIRRGIRSPHPCLKGAESTRRPNTRHLQDTLHRPCIGIRRNEKIDVHVTTLRPKAVERGFKLKEYGSRRNFSETGNLGSACRSISTSARDTIRVLVSSGWTYMIMGRPGARVARGKR
ncbi:hypothetical protein FIBSPDRAFT_422792 [Athelia psychrophila]|uniref:Uncharacterized protein n=1 Tax=Athelia psychrophila TaxID=1759441 RepID=A0A166MWX2_9AGAM|nr:hypothetical protein FIBSPDRAFT_422792 [Fibularhizoctonia sp. CBS 109695]